ncbi:MAG: S1 RNA-binding domain-containing protein [Acidobacteriota bacterium]
MSEQHPTADAENQDAPTEEAVSTANDVPQAVEEASDATASTVTEATEAASEAVEEAASEAVSEAAEVVEETAGAVEEAATEAVEAATEAVSEAAESVEEAAVEAVEAAEEAASEAVEAASETASEVAEAVEETASEAVEVAEEAAAEAVEAVSDVAEAVEESTSEAVEAAEEATAEAAEAIAEAVTETGEAAEEVASEAVEATAEAVETAEEAASEAAATAGAAADDATSVKADGEGDEKINVEEIESDEMIQLRAALDAKLSLDGQVIGWNKGGYHVALGKIAAFCPVSQIEIGNPRSPKKYLDKSFKFRVIEIQESGRRVVVSRAAALKAKRAEEAAKVREVLKAGAVLDGRVSSLTDFGAFVNLGANIEGLVHVSEVSRKRIEHAKEALSVGQKVKVQVLKIEKGGKRISLSIKRLEADPWDGVAERFKSGGEFKGTVVRATEFGLFVEVEPGLEGLLHTSRLPFGKKLEDESLAVGQEIEGWVHDVDRKRKRLSLSMRPVAEGNPWKDAEERYPEGDMFVGKVEKVTKFGVFIELEPGLTGLLPFAVLGGGDGGGGGGSNPKRQFLPGKEVKVKVLSVDTGRRRISLGTEQSKAEGSDKDYKNYVKSQRGTESGLGALAQAFAKFKGEVPAE